MDQPPAKRQRSASPCLAELEHDLESIMPQLNSILDPLLSSSSNLEDDVPFFEFDDNLLSEVENCNEMIATLRKEAIQSNDLVTKLSVEISQLKEENAKLRIENNNVVDTCFKLSRNIEIFRSILERNMQFLARHKTLCSVTAKRLAACPPSWLHDELSKVMMLTHKMKPIVHDAIRFFFFLVHKNPSYDIKRNLAKLIPKMDLAEVDRQFNLLNEYTSRPRQDLIHPEPLPAELREAFLYYLNKL